MRGPCPCNGLANLVLVGVVPLQPRAAGAPLAEVQPEVVFGEERPPEARGGEALQLSVKQQVAPCQAAELQGRRLARPVREQLVAVVQCTNALEADQGLLGVMLPQLLEEAEDDGQRVPPLGGRGSLRP